MCLLNCTTDKKKYKHFSYAERTMIERWYNKDKKSKTEIAELLNKNVTTIRCEIKKGLVTVKGYQWEDLEEYSADVAQEKYEYNKTSKGPSMILDSEPELVKHIENRIKNHKESPEVIISQLKDEFIGKVCARTIRNAIKDGNVFENITIKNLIYDKEYKNKNSKKRIAKSTPPEKSIENRPNEANERSVYGHWEGDLVIGKRKRGAALFTLTERVTREEIIIKVRGKKSEYIVKALNKLERKLGCKRFSDKFKTITFDNGGEFKDYGGLERSIFKKSKRTTVYYAHPYCSGERGTNENNNRMIRRWIPKGISIDEITEEFIQFVEDWLNNYPRAMFGYKSSNMLLSSI